jgi:hypothetical protein
MSVPRPMISFDDYGGGMSFGHNHTDDHSYICGTDVLTRQYAAYDSDYTIENTVYNVGIIVSDIAKHDVYPTNGVIIFLIMCMFIR